MSCKPLCRVLAICFAVGFAPWASGAETQTWAERLAASEIQRRGTSLHFGQNPKARLVYETGVFLKALDAVSIQTGNRKYHEFVKSLIDSYVESDGSIKTYKPEEYNLDNINCGKLLLSLYHATGDDRYRSAASLLMKQLENHPRTREGGFWHKKIYPYQMWLDGIYMASPFLAQFAALFDRPALLPDVANQILWIENHTRDDKTGLLYHGWDESRAQEWADPVTGRSRSFWGRSMGWYAMGIVDVLDFFPGSHPKRKEIVDVLKRLAPAVARYQDSGTGLWYQVVDQGHRERNYLEASASSMFVYALAKGVRENYLGREFASVAKKGYDGLVQRLIKVDPSGQVHLTGICSVAGLGGAQKRNGTFEYYVSEPVVANDLKGVGPFILAAIEIERLH
jgi:unsaturated rhamnogalacturonyl hydrolase